ncbi:hypothetical protein [Rhodobacter sp. 24-YEA-8]|uniref:hypothetical protein n=1 Tax=Rhodobacter sp. 24-YEA-8 TaxID=1884310 RepID=UPI00089AC3B8|nr:hypothetical protein [Rhodobacter sp. 24-YEA-8]SEB89984.1 hypothetical protein SAMN05519105_1541 [Rhodobacter sp. 24-YEA-8]
MRQSDIAGWQLVLVIWGEKYGAQDVNGLVAAVRETSAGLQRVLLITDRPREGLADGIGTLAFPPEFLQPAWMRGGCQAKLAMFCPELVPGDLPAIYLDLDTVVLGDLSPLIRRRRDPDAISILQSTVLPFGAASRVLHRLTAGRRYARGNSSVVVWQPGRCDYIAGQFLAMAKGREDFTGTPMRADERFISWVAQPVISAVPRDMVVKLPAEFMLPWLWLGRLYGALPWVRRRRARLAAITLPGAEVKAGTLADLPEGSEVVDRKGRRMIWSDAWLGPVRQRLLQAIRAAGGKGGSSS